MKLAKKITIIALEGIDGSGKSSVIKQISQEYSNISVFSRTKKGDFLDKVLSSNLLKKHYIFQFPIYIILSYINYFRFINTSNIILMDRCFLSNICYFFPAALTNKLIFKILMKFEVNMHPNKIFIFDIDPETSLSRDGNKKALEWLKKAREAYLKTLESPFLEKYQIEIVNTNHTLLEKQYIVMKYIKENS